MRFNISILPTAKTTSFQNRSLWQPSPEAMSAARAAVEHEYATFAENDPRLLRLTLNEAEALAWATGFPELMFPILAQEKAGTVAAWHERQKSVREPRPVQALAA